VPSSELEWRSLKTGLRQHSLPKVLFATYGLATGFFICSEKGKPYVPVKSVLAAIFMWQRDKILWQTIALQNKIRYVLREEEYFIVFLPPVDEKEHTEKR
jgi:hypothetical protein